VHACTIPELLAALTVTNTTNTTVYVAEESICNKTDLALLRREKDEKIKQDEEKLNMLSHTENIFNVVNYLVHGKLLLYLEMLHHEAQNTVEETA